MSDSAKRIQHRMQAIREQLEHDVDSAVDSARSLSDWRTYVRQHPWISLAGAVAVGYVVVPRRVEIRQPDVDTLLKLAERNKLVVQANPAPRKETGLGGKLARFVVNAALRTAVTYAGQQVGKWGTEKAAESQPTT